jgi:hypothetical protein
MSTTPAGEPQDGRTDEPPAVTGDAPPPGPHLGTLVWGLVLLGAAVAVGLAEVADVRVDPSLALPGAMLALGGLLVVGAVVTGIRRSR